ncbi:hypothetical protein GYMLUDRAFT_235759 [Collybiopsis luxurians FD-317 M1]|nr:hypothetical protein GYMLUDRAFT_235759 [Collybiopsis luxurians FD-317 M1]
MPPKKTSTTKSTPSGVTAVDDSKLMPSPDKREGMAPHFPVALPTNFRLSSDNGQLLTPSRSPFTPTVPVIATSKKRSLGETDSATDEPSTHPPLIPTNPESLEPSRKRSKDDFTLNPHKSHFDDPTVVIIQVESDSFRISQKLLSDQSDWFRDRFASPKGPDLDKLVEGCKVYILDTPVKSEHFSTLLDFIRDPLLYRGTKANHNALCSIFYASSILVFPRYRDWAITRLENQYWSSDITKINSQSLRTITDCFMILDLSKTLDFPSLKKRALYDLIRAKAPSNPVTLSKLTTTFSDAAFVSHILQVVSMARQIFAESWADRACLDIPGLPCADSDSCVTTRNLKDAYMDYMHHPKDGLYKRYLFDPVAGLQALVDLAWEKPGEGEFNPTRCSACIERMKDAWRADREALWSLIDELEKTQRAEPSFHSSSHIYASLLWQGDTPANAKLLSYPAYQIGVTVRQKTTLRIQALAFMPMEVPIQFVHSVLPLSKSLSALADRIVSDLAKHGIYNGSTKRWRYFPQDPCSTTGNEREVFAPLTDIFEAIVNAAKKLDKNLEQNLHLKVEGTLTLVVLHFLRQPPRLATSSSLLPIPLCNCQQAQRMTVTGREEGEVDPSLAWRLKNRNRCRKTLQLRLAFLTSLWHLSTT